jgi:hypothetical protein
LAKLPNLLRFLWFASVSFAVAIQKDLQVQIRSFFAAAAASTKN